MTGLLSSLQKKTVSRLLNKSDGRAGRGGARSRIAAAAAAPAISYRQTAEGAELRLPTGVECPITAQQPRSVTGAVRDGVTGGAVWQVLCGLDLFLAWLADGVPGLRL